MTQGTLPSKAVVNTARVKRRTVRFSSLDEVVAEMDRLVVAEREGRLRAMGNWTLGQTLGHLAVWAEFAFAGTPMKAPWWMKVFLRPTKRIWLNGKLPAGAKLPKVPGGTLGIELMPTEAGRERYRVALERLKREAPQKPNVIFGVLTHEEWQKLNMRHAELHLGFMGVE